MVRIARALPGVPVVPEQLDRDPFLFNCKNGTLDLRTGELRAHRRGDRLTKMAPVTCDLDATAPLWEHFLFEIMGGDPDLLSFLQRAVGYAMTGSVEEQALFFLHGSGANGKSTFLRTLLEVFGDYGKQSAPDILLAKRNESHPTEIADLFGARLVVCQETEAGRSLAESVIKKLTGGDMIKARLMGQDFWEFAPTHKFFWAANHKPKVSGIDEAIWRRLMLIPFSVIIPKPRRDKQLLEKLRTEQAGILRWAVEGCREWRVRGLAPPAKVVEATQEYRKEEDRLAAFLEEWCEVGPELSVVSSDLFRAYVQWCERASMRPASRRIFSDYLSSHQFTADKGSKGTRHWHGLRLREDHARPARSDERDGDDNTFRWSDA
jgi:putative DNA primase/helicase